MKTDKDRAIEYLNDELVALQKQRNQYLETYRDLTAGILDKPIRYYEMAIEAEDQKKLIIIPDELDEVDYFYHAVRTPRNCSEDRCCTGGCRYQEEDDWNTGGKILRGKIMVAK